MTSAIIAHERAKWQRISGASSFHQRREFQPKVDLGANPFCVERQMTDQVELRVRFTNPKLYAPLAQSPSQAAREAAAARSVYGQAHFGRRALNQRSGGAGVGGRTHWTKTSHEAKLARSLAARRAEYLVAQTAATEVEVEAAEHENAAVERSRHTSAPASNGRSRRISADAPLVSFRDDVLRLDPSGVYASKGAQRARVGVARGGPRRVGSQTTKNPNVKTFGHRSAEAARHFDPFSKTLDRRHCSGLARRADASATPSLLTADSLASLLSGSNRSGSGAAATSTTRASSMADTFAPSARRSLGGSAASKRRSAKSATAGRRSERRRMGRTDFTPRAEVLEELEQTWNSSYQRPPPMLADLQERRARRSENLGVEPIYDAALLLDPPASKTARGAMSTTLGTPVNSTPKKWRGGAHSKQFDRFARLSAGVPGGADAAHDGPGTSRVEIQVATLRRTALRRTAEEKERLRMEAIERAIDRKVAAKKRKEQRRAEVFADSQAARRRKWTPGLV